MSRFEDFVMEWKGREYRVPSRSLMGALARVEDHVTLVELQRYAARQTVPLAKVASAFASLLQYAGASVTAEDVYSGMFEDDDPNKNQEKVQLALMALMELMVPKPLQGNRQAQPAAPTPAPASKAATVANSSRKRSKSAARTRGRAG
jgi:hypothetical protein